MTSHFGRDRVTQRFAHISTFCLDAHTFVLYLTAYILCTFYGSLFHAFTRVNSCMKSVKFVVKDLEGLLFIPWAVESCLFCHVVWFCFV